MRSSRLRRGVGGIIAAAFIVAAVVLVYAMVQTYIEYINATRSVGEERLSLLNEAAAIESSVDVSWLYDQDAGLLTVNVSNGYHEPVCATGLVIAYDDGTYDLVAGVVQGRLGSRLIAVAVYRGGRVVEEWPGGSGFKLPYWLPPGDTLVFKLRTRGRRPSSVRASLSSASSSTGLAGERYVPVAPAPTVRRLYVVNVTVASGYPRDGFPVAMILDLSQVASQEGVARLQASSIRVYDPESSTWLPCNVTELGGNTFLVVVPATIPAGGSRTYQVYVLPSGWSARPEGYYGVGLARPVEGGGGLVEGVNLADQHYVALSMPAGTLLEHSPTGTLIAPGTVTMPFPLPFFSKEYSTAYVHLDGRLSPEGEQPKLPPSTDELRDEMIVASLWRACDWHLPGWRYRRPITIVSSLDEDLEGYPVRVVLNSSNFDFSKAKSDGSDLRFVDEGGDQLAYYIEEWDAVNQEAIVWVKVPLIPAGGSVTIYMYYGNPSATSPGYGVGDVFTLVGEAGTVDVDENGVPVSFMGAYDEDEPPVIIASVDTFNDEDTVVSRITNRSATGFTIRLEEYPSQDGDHDVETVGWVALRPGVWEVGGKVWEVGTVEVSTTGPYDYTTVTFQHEFTETPAILTYINSYNEGSPSGGPEAGAHTRQDDPSATGFEVKIEEEKDTSHTNEIVGYVAVEPGANETVNGLKFEAGVVYPVRHVRNHNDEGSDDDDTPEYLWGTYSFTAGFTSTPVVVFKVMTENGSHNCHERIDDLASTGFKYALQETPAFDGPHPYVERGGFLAIEPGLIYGRPYVGEEPSVSVGGEVEGPAIYRSDGSALGLDYVSFWWNDTGMSCLNGLVVFESGDLLMQWEEVGEDVNYTVGLSNGTGVVGEYAVLASPHEGVRGVLPPRRLMPGVDVLLLRLEAYMYSVTGVEVRPYMPGWRYCRALTITNRLGTPLEDYQVLVELNSSSFDFTRARGDGGDLRFVDPRTMTLLPYFIEEWDPASGRGLVWVRVSDLPADGSITIYMFYGNPSATTMSDPVSVFTFYEDFHDLSRWVVETNIADGGYVASASNGVLVVAGSYTSTNRFLNVELKPLLTPLPGLAVEARCSPRTGQDHDLRLDLYEPAYTGLHPGSAHGVYVHAWGYHNNDHDPHRGVWAWYLRNDTHSLWDETAWDNAVDPPFQAGEWYRLRLAVFNGTAYYQVYDDEWSLIAYKTTAYSHLGSLRLVLGNCNGGATGFWQEAWYDWVRARVYVSPEPTTSIGEETAYY